MNPFTSPLAGEVGPLAQRAGREGMNPFTSQLAGEVGPLAPRAGREGMNPSPPRSRGRSARSRREPAGRG